MDIESEGTPTEAFRAMKRSRCWFGVWALITVSSCLAGGDRALAQIIPDDTLGAEGSRLVRDVVIRGQQGDRIEGGAVRGSNLFHSFETFNIRAGQRVYFDSPGAIANIFSRVTGNDVSDVRGTLGVDGGANLYLLNPNGILFGPNARLDIAGSFVVSTGDRFIFPNGAAFSAVNPQVPPLLMVHVPIGLQYGANPGTIRAQGSNLEVGVGQELTLAGGAIELVNTTLYAPAGEINLISIGGTGSIQRDRSGHFTVPDHVPRANITSSRGTSVRNGVPEGSRGNAGNINVIADSLVLRSGTQFSASTFGSGNTGDIRIDVQDTLEVRGTSPDGTRSGIFNRVVSDAVGQGGTIRITANNLSILDGAIISASTFGVGDAGDIAIDVQDTLEVRGTSPDGTSSGIFDSVNSGAVGQGGTIRITAHNLQILDGAQINASTSGNGNAGNITLSAIGDINLTNSRITSESNGNDSGRSSTIRIESIDGSVLLNQAEISAENDEGAAGDIFINANDEIALTNQSTVSTNGTLGQIFIGYSDTPNSATDPSPDHDLIPRSINLIDSVLTATSTEEGVDSAGDITLLATGDINLTNSRINSDSNSSGEDYSITWIESTGGSVLLNQAEVSAENDEGSAGDILINANHEIRLENNSTVSTNGNFGRIFLGVSDIPDNDIDLSPNDDPVSQTIHLTNSLLTASTNSGVAGDIDVRASESIVLNGVTEAGRGGIIAEATANGDAGSITVDTPTLTITNSEIAASTETGIAGSISIHANGAAAGLVQVQHGGRITVSAPTGQAGSLDVSAHEIRLDNGSITAETGFSPENGQGADIQLEDLDILLMRNGSLISARASGGADGGNVAIDAANGFIVAIPFENNDVIATAEQGNGGNITIHAINLFGLSDLTAERLSFEQLRGNETSDINASSNFGTQGVVTLDILNIDPSQGVTELSGSLVDASQHIAPGCGLGDNLDESEFIVTGRGGLPPSASDPIAANPIGVPWVVADEEVSVTNGAGPIATALETPLVEAQGMHVDPEGNIYLVAEAEADGIVNPTAIAHQFCGLSSHP